MKKIVVIDPGMMEAGGHHAALLSTFLSYEEICSHQITFVTHKQLEVNLYEQIIQTEITVVRHFTTNFYENYGSYSSSGDYKIQSYVRKLASEYIAIYENLYCQLSDAMQSIFFYPCLNREHASALSLAMEYMKQQHSEPSANQIHKICCMFLPNDRDNGNIQHLFYKQAFTSLSTKQRIELYASDYETKQYYENLNIPIKGIHPCYLLPWEQIDNTKYLEKKNPKLLLYLGDAKKDKGFNTLPELITRLLTEFDYNVSLVVQYTLAWDYPELRECIAALEVLDSKYEQVEIYKNYWSAYELVAELSEVDTIYCTYCTHTYENKSSGLAWLASFFKIPVVLYGPSWLSREFERLGHNYSLMENDKVVDGVSHIEMKDYSNTLYSSILKWLIC